MCKFEFLWLALWPNGRTVSLVSRPDLALDDDLNLYLATCSLGVWYVCLYDCCAVTQRVDEEKEREAIQEWMVFIENVQPKEEVSSLQVHHHQVKMKMEVMMVLGKREE